jgi:DNA-binding IclR family transcriptional regulator
MPRVSFGNRVVQKLKRVSLNHNLLENLQVKEGDTIDLYFDTDEQAIVIKKSNAKGAKIDK